MIACIQKLGRIPTKTTYKKLGFVNNAYLHIRNKMFEIVVVVQNKPSETKTMKNDKL